MKHQKERNLPARRIQNPQEFIGPEPAYSSPPSPVRQNKFHTVQYTRQRSERLAVEIAIAKFSDNHINKVVEEQYDLAHKIQAGKFEATGLTRKSETYITLKERLGAMVAACLTEKTTCKSLLDPSFRLRFAFTPKVEAQAKRKNRKGNMYKANKITFGYAASKAGHTADDFVGPNNLATNYETSAKASTDRISKYDVSTYLTKGSSPNKRKPANLFDQDERTLTCSPRPAKKARVTCTNSGTSIKSTSAAQFPHVIEIVKTSVARPEESQLVPIPLITSVANRKAEGHLDLEIAYKRTICSLLEVPHSFTHMTLLELRTFGGVYDKRYILSGWRIKLLPKHVGCGPFFSTLGPGNDQQSQDHIALLCPEFLDIAITRGDIELVEGKLQVCSNRLFTAQNGLHPQALGMADNTFGLLQHELTDCSEVAA